MRHTMIGLAALAAIAVSVLPGTASAQVATSHACPNGGAGLPRSNEVFLFQNGNFVGPCSALFVGFYPYAGNQVGGFGLPNDSISSLKVGSGVRARLYHDGIYSGSMLTKTPGNYGVIDNGWNDVISSIRVESNARSPICNDLVAGEFALFQNPNFGGDCVVLRYGIYPTLESMGIANDSVSSVKTGPPTAGNDSCAAGAGWIDYVILWSGVQQSGTTTSVAPSSSNANLATSGFDNVTSSVTAIVTCQAPPKMTYYGGPVISAPNIFLLFWGFDQTNANDLAKMTAADTFMTGYVQYMSNAVSPIGMEPTIRQYGVWGASYLGFSVDTAAAPTSTGFPSDAQIQAEVSKMQGQNGQNGVKVPAYSPNLLVLTVVKSVPGCGGFHRVVQPYDANQGRFYGIVAYQQNCGFATPPYFTTGATVDEQWFEVFAGHEINEFATDPLVIYGPGGGWIYTDMWNARGEVNDCGLPGDNGDPACVSGDQVLFPNGYMGQVNHILDNDRGTCSSFTTEEHDSIAVTRWDRDSPDGLSVVARGMDGSVWYVDQGEGDAGGWETPTSLAFESIEGLATISSGATQDIFAIGTDGGLYQFTRTFDTDWTMTPMGGRIFGAPSAAYHNGHKVVVVLGTDGHPYVFDDGGTGNWSLAQLPIPSGNVLAMSPPRVYPRANLPGTVDIMFTGYNGHVYRAVWGSESSCPPFADIASTATDIPFESNCVPNQTDVFFRGTDGAVYQVAMNGNTPSAPINQGGVIFGGPTATETCYSDGSHSVMALVRGLGTDGGNLWASEALWTPTVFNGWSQVTSFTATSTPTVHQTNDSLQLIDLFARRHSDGHVIVGGYSDAAGFGGWLDTQLVSF